MTQYDTNGMDDASKVMRRCGDSIFKFSKTLIIFDVSSYHGQFIDEINFFDKNNCFFHLFEPIEKDFRVLQYKFREKKTNTIFRVKIPFRKSSNKCF